MLKTCASLLLAAASTFSFAAPPTEASVQTLLEVTRAEAMVEQAYASMEQMVRQAMTQQVAGRKLSDEQRRIVEAAPLKLATLMRTELSWAALRPIYMGIYQETFDQAEIDGLITFYQSPVGQSFVSKMPAVMHRMTAVMQVQMQTLVPKLQQAMEEVVREAKLPPRT